MQTYSYEATKNGIRRYGNEFYGTYKLLYKDNVIGYETDYLRVIKIVVNKLNTGEMKLEDSGFTNNDKILYVCDSCKNIHLDGTRNNC